MGVAELPRTLRMLCLAMMMTALLGPSVSLCGVPRHAVRCNHAYMLPQECNRPLFWEVKDGGARG
jgi:hypothetical protein